MSFSPKKDLSTKVPAQAITLSHVIWRGTIQFQRALQILAVCGVTEVKIKLAVLVVEC